MVLRYNKYNYGKQECYVTAKFIENQHIHFRKTLNQKL